MKIVLKVIKTTKTTKKRANKVKIYNKAIKKEITWKQSRKTVYYNNKEI